MKQRKKVILYFLFIFATIMRKITLLYLLLIATVAMAQNSDYQRLRNSEHREDKEPYAVG